MEHFPQFPKIVFQLHMTLNILTETWKTTNHSCPKQISISSVHRHLSLSSTIHSPPIHSSYSFAPFHCHILTLYWWMANLVLLRVIVFFFFFLVGGIISIIIIIVYRQHGFLWISLAIHPYQPSALVRQHPVLMNVYFCWLANIGMSLCRIP